MKIRTILMFIFLLSLGAFIAWLGGYNFDHRSPDVAFNASMGIFWAAVFSYLWDVGLDE